MIISSKLSQAIIIITTIAKQQKSFSNSVGRAVASTAVGMVYPIILDAGMSRPSRRRYIRFDAVASSRRTISDSRVDVIMAR